jgi:hypothetical protein
MAYIRKGERAFLVQIIRVFQGVMEKKVHFPSLFKSPAIGREFAGAQRLYRYCVEVQGEDAVALAVRLVRQWATHDHWKVSPSLVNVAYHAQTLVVELALAEDKVYDWERDDEHRSYDWER